MSVSTLNIKNGPYAGNNIAASFPYTFKIEKAEEVVVYETDSLGVTTLLTLATHYTVSGLGDTGGGNITRVAGPLPLDYTWNIRANYVPTQDTAFASQGGFFPDIHEDSFDKLSYIAQQHEDLIGRGIGLKQYDEVGDMTLPVKVDRLGVVLAFDEVTGRPVAGPNIASIGTVVGNTANINTVADNIENVNTAAVNMPAIIAAPDEAANAATSENNAANSAISSQNAAAVALSYTTSGFMGTATLVDLGFVADATVYFPTDLGALP